MTGFVVAGETAVACDPAEGALDDRTARQRHDGSFGAASEICTFSPTYATLPSRGAVQVCHVTRACRRLSYTC